MCQDCVDAYDAASAMPPTPVMLKLVQKVEDLYACEGCSVGGPLHVVVDDYNVDDGFLNDWQRAQAYDPWWDDNPDRDEIRRLSNEILDGFATLTEEQRAAVLAIRDGYLS